MMQETTSRPRRGDVSAHQRIAELEAALDRAHHMATLANKRADLYEERAREVMRFALWGGRRPA